MKIEDILLKVPDYKVFYTVDEMDSRITLLEEKYPGSIETFVAGDSRKGHPIRCMKIGRGEKNALCFACPHPNEPIGAMTILTLAEILAGDRELTDEFGFTWYFIPCIDPDGTRLNEAWFKGPFTIKNYALNFYRPPGYRQVEWTFPVDIPGWYFNSPIPETQILMKYMEELKPELLVSLHNSAYGGAYWYLTKGDPVLCEALENAAKRQNVPLHLGEPEAEYMKNYSDAVFPMMSIKEFVANMQPAEEATEKAEQFCGGCSGDYIETICDCQTVIAELPYFYDPRIEDKSPSDMTHGEAMRENARLKRTSYVKLLETWNMVSHLFTEDNPFHEFVKTCIDAFDIEAESKYLNPENQEGQEKATVSQVFDNIYGARIFEIVNFGLSARACEYELKKLGPNDKHKAEILTQCRKEFLDNAERLCAWVEENAATDVIPIRKLVSVQLESALLTAKYVTGQL